MGENKKSRFTPILIAIAAVVGSAGGSALVRHLWRHPPAIDRALVEASDEINRNLPQTLDADTRLDTTMAAPDKTLIYHYTLVNTDAGDLDTAKFTDLLRPGIVNAYRTHASLKSFREMGVTMKYNYSDRNGVFITEIRVGPGDL